MTRRLGFLCTFAFVMIALLLAVRLSSSALKEKTPAHATTAEKHALPMEKASPVVVAKEASPAPTPTHPAGVNAADLYKDAFQLLNALSDEEKKIIAHPRDEVDADKAAALFEKIQPIMDLLRRAKDAEYCDWGVTVHPLRFDTPMPQLNAVVKLGQLAFWDAGYRFSSDPDGAVDDLATRAHLGRTIGGESWIGFLAGSSFHAGVINLVSENAAKLSPENASQVAEMLDPSTLNEDFRNAVAGVAEMQQSFLDDLSDPQKRKKVLDSMGTEDRLQEVLHSPVQNLSAQVKWLQQTEKELPQKAQLPDADINAWWAQVNEQARSQPLASPVLETMKGFLDRYRFNSVNSTMLSAGLAVLQNGAEALASFRDPTNGRAFTFVPTATGFELRSTFQYKNKPVTLAFPTTTASP